MIFHYTIFRNVSLKEMTTCYLPENVAYKCAAYTVGVGSQNYEIFRKTQTEDGKEFASQSEVKNLMRIK
jgi:hypothetical protein